jgi:hypothetical protein
VKPVKLGKKPAVHNPKALRFGTYLKASALPYVPLAYHWGTAVPHWRMYGNDTLGNCTIAAVGHHAGLWTFRESGTELLIPESEIVSAYSAVSGYVPGNESTDNGAVMTDVLKYWISTGVGGSKIEAYTTLEPGNNSEVEAAIFLMGGIYIGIQMPITAQTQSTLNGTWSLVPGYKTNPDAAPGSWGGHCVPVIGYSKTSLQVISWGEPINMSWGFYQTYVDEAYAPLSPEWVTAGHVAPNHFDLAQLQADLKTL